MKAATIYTAATVLLLAIALAALAVLKQPAEGGLKSKAEERRQAIEEATHSLTR